MKKFLIIILFVFSQLITVAVGDHPDDQEKMTDYGCVTLIMEYPIDPKIKSTKGWRRVFESEKWKERFKLDKYEPKELECLKKYIMENTMDVRKYNRFVGMELEL